VKTYGMLARKTDAARHVPAARASGWHRGRQHKPASAAVLNQEKRRKSKLSKYLAKAKKRQTEKPSAFGICIAIEKAL